MVKEYTISELADIFKISKQATDKKIKKLESCGLKTIIRSINNRPTKIVFLSDSELDSLIQNSYSNQPNLQPEINTNQSHQQPEQPTNYEVMQLLAQYAERSGKYDLLEDKQKELRDDIKYWQNKFFENENELKTLIKSNTQLEMTNRQLEKENAQLKEELQKSKGWQFWKK